MDSIAISLFSLVKNNNGVFKSEKQGNFLLSKCDTRTGANEYVIPHDNNMLTVMILDNKGVKHVNKVRTIKGERTWINVFNREGDQAAFDVFQKPTSKNTKAVDPTVKNKNNLYKSQVARLDKLLQNDMPLMKVLKLATIKTEIEAKLTA